MSNSNQCLPPRGQLFHFPPTNGPLLLLGEGQLTRRQYLNRCGGPCAAPRVPQGTVVFFQPPKVAPPYRPPMPPTPVAPHTPLFYNGAQTCVNSCPEGEGDPISVTVDAGEHVSTVSQAAADAAAMAAACAAAAALREDAPCGVAYAAAYRVKAGVAELCGFEEFTTPSTPPKKFIDKTITGVFEVFRSWFSYFCETDTCLGSNYKTFTNVTDGFGGGSYSGYLSVTEIANDGITVTFLVNYLIIDNSTGLPSPNAECVVPGPVNVPDGGTFDAAYGTNFNVAIRWTVYPYSFVEACIQAGQEPNYVDTWNQSQSYDPDSGCLLGAFDTDSTRTYPAPLAPVSPIPSAEALAGEPEEEYVPEVNGFLQPVELEFATTQTQRTTKTTTGLGCRSNPIDVWTLGGPLSTQGTGAVVTALSNEDTDDAAVYRALAAIVSWTPAIQEDAISSQEQRGAGEFDLDFSVGQFNIEIGTLSSPLTIGAYYDVQVTFGKRAYGSADPLTPLDVYTFSILAAAETGETGWQNIPRRVGQEVVITDFTVAVGVAPGDAVGSAGMTMDDFGFASDGSAFAALANDWTAAVASEGGTVTAQSSFIANGLVNALQAETAIFNKIIYLNPFLGADIIAATVPLIDDLGVGPSVNSGFVDADFSESTGLQCGNLKYFDSLIYPSDLNSTDQRGGIGVWELNTTRPLGSWVMGATDNASLQYFALRLDTTLQRLYWGAYGFLSYVTSSPATPGGFQYGQRRATNNLSLYYDLNTPEGYLTPYTPGVMTERTIYIGGENDGVFGPQYSEARLGLAIMTDGTLTDSEIQVLWVILNDYLITPTGRV